MDQTAWNSLVVGTDYRLRHSYALLVLRTGIEPAPCVLIRRLLLLMLICQVILLYCLFVVSAEQMDEGLAGRQRQYEGLIHNLGKELNLCRAANQELSSKLREMRSPVNQAGDQSKGDNCL